MRPAVSVSALGRCLSLVPAPVGAPGLGLVALVWSDLAAHCCFHPLAQRLGAAGRDERSLAAHGDPHTFQGIEQDAPAREPGSEVACLLGGLGVVVWHGVPLLAEGQPVCPAYG